MLIHFSDMITLILLSIHVKPIYVSLVTKSHCLGKSEFVAQFAHTIPLIGKLVSPLANVYNDIPIRLESRLPRTPWKSGIAWFCGERFFMMTIPVIKNNLLSNHIGKEKISICIDIQIRIMTNKN